MTIVTVRASEWTMEILRMAGDEIGWSSATMCEMALYKFARELARVRDERQQMKSEMVLHMAEHHGK